MRLQKSNSRSLTVTRFHLALILGISVAAGFFVLLYSTTAATRWSCRKTGQQRGSTAEKPPVEEAGELERINSGARLGGVKQPEIMTAENHGESGDVIVQEKNVARIHEIND